MMTSRCPSGRYSMSSSRSQSRAGAAPSACARLAAAPRQLSRALRLMSPALDSGVRGAAPHRAAPHTCSSAQIPEASTSSTSASPGDKKIGVLFVCLVATITITGDHPCGMASSNICRSPTAEAMFRAVAQRNGVAQRFDIDSCGTGGGNSGWYTEGGWSYHEGDDSDPRMTATAVKRGVVLTSKSRPLVPLDMSRFDYIIGMDAKNIRAVQVAADYWIGRKAGGAPAVPTDYQSKLSLMTVYCRKAKGASEVPDPYYGGAEGFEKVLDLLDDACEGLLETIRRQHSF